MHEKYPGLASLAKAALSVDTVPPRGAVKIIVSSPIVTTGGNLN